MRSNRPLTVFALLGLVAALAAGCAAQGSGATSPSPHASTGGCLRGDGGCLGTLPAGEWQSESVDLLGTDDAGQLRYTTVDGAWANALDHTASYWIQEADAYAQSSGDSYLTGIYVFADVAPALQEYPACPEEADPAAAVDAASMASWLDSLPGAESSAAPARTIGGHTAYGVDVELAPTGAPSCSFASPFLTVVASRAGFADPYLFGIGAGEKIRAYFVDLGDGHTAGIIIDTYGDFDEFAPRAEELLDTFRFGGG